MSKLVLRKSLNICTIGPVMSELVLRNRSVTIHFPQNKLRHDWAYSTYVETFPQNKLRHDWAYSSYVETFPKNKKILIK
jgi:hypothetical protein